MKPLVALVLKGYPRLSETFIASEIRALERRGLEMLLYSMRLPTDEVTHPVHRAIRAPVRYLPEYLHHAPLRVLRAWTGVRRRAGYRAARRAWLRDLVRNLTRNRIRRFGQAIVLAHELPHEVTWLHAHFLHTPASVTRYASTLTGLPWSVSAHAKDVWTIPTWEKREKLAHCRWLVTCAAYHARHLAALAPDPDRVALIYHGIDFATFGAPQLNRPSRDGSDCREPVILLSVGRAVEKKGYDVLLAALARLPPGLHWKFVHIGSGPLLRKLSRSARRLGLTGRIEWQGAQPQERVLAAYREADMFVLACRVARDGDRDGLPNVLMEAQSQALACVSTRVSAIPELMIDGETGVLVPAEDAAALAEALALLIRSPELRLRLGRAGQARVRCAFSFEAGIDRLAARFGVAPADVTQECASPSMRR